MKSWIGCWLWAGILIGTTGYSQSLDWDTDVIAFGTGQQERCPCLSTTADGTIRVFCVADETAPRFRISTNQGVSWQTFAWLANASNCGWAATSDATRHHALLWSPSIHDLTLYTFAGSQMAWDSVRAASFAGPDTPDIESMALTTDAAYEADEPYLNVGWIERDAITNGIAARFRQSRDRGETLRPLVTVFTAQDDSQLANNLSMAVSWSGDAETIWLAATTDRLGSVPEQVALFRSGDQGLHWSEGLAPDSSAYPQVNVSIAAHGNTLIVVYARRVSAASQREIFYTYTLDGGETFAPPAPLTQSADDDYSPRVVIDAASERIAVFYLSGDVQRNPATLWVREGPLGSPWIFSEAVRVSAVEGATRGKGYDVTAFADGFAAVWSGPGILGDDDIFFDASWRGVSVDDGVAALPETFRLHAPFPNPFNSFVTLRYDVTAETALSFGVYDLLGRQVRRLEVGRLSPGAHATQIDFSGLASGSYLIRAGESPQEVTRVQFVK